MDEQLEHDPAVEEDPGWPVGFMVMAGLAGLYLVFRLIEMTVRFFEWVF